MCKSHRNAGSNELLMENQAMPMSKKEKVEKNK